jgi:hypothetical protein
MKAKLLVLIVGLLAFVITACSSTAAPGTPESADELIAALEAQGLGVSKGQRLEADLFSVPALLLEGAEGSLQVMEYSDQAAAEADAGMVDASGSSIGTAQPFWVDVPHFFKSGKLIVLYVGSDEQVLSTLEAVFGPQFAGR